MTQQNSHGNQIQDIPQTGFFGHPRGLGVLFFVEFWERFSYYGMRALLIFYMYFAVTDNGLGIDKTTAMSIMSVYGSLIYMTSIPGGWIADRITGTRGATLLGAVFIIIGSVVLAIVLIIVIGALTNSLSFNLVSNTVLVLGIALPIIYFTLIIRSKDVTDTERSRVKAFIPLFILGMVFWAIQEQGSNVLNIYGIEHSDMKLNLFGWKTNFGEAIFQSINPLFILLLAPIISLLWQKLGTKQPSLPVKFAIGTFLAGASYILIGIVGYASGSSNFSVNWVILSYIICVIGELCLSPTGNSAAVKLAPKAFNAQMMSIWYLTNASAQAINGTLVKLIEPLGQTNYFIFLGVVAIIVTTIVLAFSPLIIKAMKGIR